MAFPEEEGGGRHPRSMHEAEIEHLCRVLQGYGTLTRDHLYEQCARDWTHGTFKSVLAEAVRQGRVRRLSEEIYECVDPDANGAESSAR